MQAPPGRPAAGRGGLGRAGGGSRSAGAAGRAGRTLPVPERRGGSPAPAPPRPLKDPAPRPSPAHLRQPLPNGGSGQAALPKGLRQPRFAGNRGAASSRASAVGSGGRAAAHSPRPPGAPRFPPVKRNRGDKKTENRRVLATGAGLAGHGLTRGLPPPGPTFLRERCRSLGAVKRGAGAGREGGRAGRRGRPVPRAPYRPSRPPYRGGAGRRARGPRTRAATPPAPHSSANRRQESAEGAGLETVVSHWLNRASLTACPTPPLTLGDDRGSGSFPPLPRGPGWQRRRGWPGAPPGLGPFSRSRSPAASPVKRPPLLGRAGGVQEGERGREGAARMRRGPRGWLGSNAHARGGSVRYPEREGKAPARSRRAEGGARAPPVGSAEPVAQPRLVWTRYPDSSGLRPSTPRG